MRGLSWYGTPGLSTSKHLTGYAPGFITQRGASLQAGPLFFSGLLDGPYLGNFSVTSQNLSALLSSSVLRKVSICLNYQFFKDLLQAFNVGVRIWERNQNFAQIDQERLIDLPSKALLH